MKTATLSIFLSVISIGAVGALYVKVDDLADRVSIRRARSTATSTAPAEEVVRPHIPRAANSRGSMTDGESPTDESRRAETSSSTKDQQRIESLEKQVDDLRRKSRPHMPFLGNRRFYRNVDDLARGLKLTANQKDRMTYIVDRGKTLIEEIMEIPDEEGKSPAQRRKAARKKLQERFAKGGGGVAGNIMPLIQELTGHRNKVIPGRNVTYGQEIDRVQNETRAEMETVLDHEQKEQFKDANTGALLGGAAGPAGGISVFQSVSTMGPGGEHGEGESTTEVIVGGMTPVEIEVIEETEEPTDE